MGEGWSLGRHDGKTGFFPSNYARRAASTQHEHFVKAGGGYVRHATPAGPSSIPPSSCLPPLGGDPLAGLAQPPRLTLVGCAVLCGSCAAPAHRSGPVLGSATGHDGLPTAWTPFSVAAPRYVLPLPAHSVAGAIVHPPFPRPTVCLLLRWPCWQCLSHMWSSSTHRIGTSVAPVCRYRVKLLDQCYIVVDSATAASGRRRRQCLAPHV
jgi:hypothetical protein